MTRQNTTAAENNNEAQENGNGYGVPIEMAVPIVGVGAFILALALVFCVYQCMIRRSYRSSAVGYKEIVVKKQGKTNDLESLKCRMCVVCLDPFKTKDVLALCPCGHVFHKKCLNKWLKRRLVCPMCMEEIKPPSRCGQQGDLRRTRGTPV